MSTVRGRLAGLAVVLAIVAMGGLGLAWQHGYRLYIVHTGSMEPGLRPGDAVLDAPVTGPVRPGQAVTFAVASGPDTVVTHRVVSVEDGLIHTQGDANRSADSWALHPGQLRGLPVATLPRGRLCTRLPAAAGRARLDPHRDPRPRPPLEGVLPRSGGSSPPRRLRTASSRPAG